jgi:hypothetical protein
LLDLAADTGALAVQIDPDTLKGAGPFSRALAPDVVLFARGIDPALCLEMVERLGEAEAIILDRDDPRYAGCLEALEDVRGVRALSFGTNRDAAVRLIDCQLYTTCSAVQIQSGRLAFDFCIGAPGPHRVSAALAALTTVKALGGDLATAAGRFAGADEAEANAPARRAGPA